ncbi:Helix-hairpin-helix containing domain-containing protein [Paraburkholderia phenazinium]|uniref:Helix-hairpin-helix containing domain-containing protein n=1 Tax=Paraburkholderia phenazinium TaxID=60549 RepID=A0A1G8DIW7_9BURK|nr:Helix-hairpin-helix containing domain-containing protein [Paraburkholderia phenazinium]
MILIGTTTRITHASPHGGVVFRFLPDDSVRSVRVKADYDVIRDAPDIGDRLSVQGEFERGHYGLQLVAAAVLPEPASPASLDTLLSGNHTFVHVPNPIKRQLSARLGSQLLSTLENADVDKLIACGAEFSVAHDLVAAWTDYSATIVAKRFLLDHGVSQDTASMAARLWGNDIVDVVRENPYRLLAVAPWHEVDAVATSMFHCAHDDNRRYLGFAASIFNEGASQGRAALFMSEFEELFAERIGGDTDVKTAFSRCIQAKRMRIVKTGRAQYIQGATLAKVETQIQSHLQRLLASEPNPTWLLKKRPRLDVVPGLFDRLGRFIQENPIVLVNMPGAAATAIDEIVSAINGETLIISPTLAFACPSSGEVRTHRLREFTDGGPPPDVTGKVVVVLEASMLDLLTAKKLLRNTADAAKLVLVGDRRMLPAFGPGHIFPGLMQSDAIPSIDTTKRFKSSSIPTPLASLPALLPSANALHAIAELAQYMPVDSTHRLTSTVLAQYRAIFEENPSEGIIIASTRALATLLNDALHQEVVDYAVSQGSPHATISLQNKQTATVGDQVIYMSRDFSRGLFHGSRGLVTEIFPNTGKTKCRNSTAVAKIEFDTAGWLEVSARDCLSMMLGHAVQVHHASMSRWRKVIIAAAPSQNLNNSWLWRSATRAVEQLVIVDLAHSLRDALTKEVRESSYVPLLDWSRR